MYVPHFNAMDDDAAIRRSVGFMLKTSGFQVRNYESGVDLLKAVQDLESGCILLDIRMPGMDGHEVARRLRKDLGLKSSILVALSGYGQKSDRLLSRDSGFDHHLAKPVNLDELVAIIDAPGPTG